jgi:Methyltransferase FkbM domain
MGGRILDAELATSEVLQIQAATLDDHFDPRPGVVKIDVEGSEARVLKGASRMLAEGNLRWIVETHDKDLQALVLSLFSRASYSAQTADTKHDTEYGRHYVIAAREPILPLQFLG